MDIKVGDILLWEPWINDKNAVGKPTVYIVIAYSDILGAARVAACDANSDAYLGNSFEASEEQIRMSYEIYRPSTTAPKKTCTCLAFTLENFGCRCKKEHKVNLSEFIDAAKVAIDEAAGEAMRFISIPRNIINPDERVSVSSGRVTVSRRPSTTELAEGYIPVGCQCPLCTGTWRSGT